MQFQILTAEQIEHFLARGYCVVRGAVPQKLVEEWASLAFERLGYDRQNPATWREPRVHLKPSRVVEVRPAAPLAFAATCDVVGGAARISEPYIWGDTFVANFSEGAGRPYQSASAQSPGWHKDGYFFRHFLDSPEQGLLSIVAWTDVLSRGGGTFIAPDSVGVVARFLAAHPQGVEPNVFGDLIQECREFEEITARAGDLVLLHPFMLHAVSQNPLKVARIISNPPLFLREPLNFNRDNPDDFSLVERAVLRALNVQRLDFKATSPRRADFPRWVLQAQDELRSSRETVGAGNFRTLHLA